MAIIYSYPNLPLSELSSNDTLVINDTNANDEIVTKTVSLSNLATYVTGTGSGTGTTNKIVKFTDGANGLLGDSIMTESTGLIDLAGQFVSTSSPTLTQAGPVSGIKAILNGTTAAPNVALYGESINTGSTQANSNYGLFAKGEFEGTAGFTGFVIGGNLEGRYDGTGTNGANATVYGSYNLARATTAANGTVSYMIGANNLAKLEGANVTATNLQATHSTVELSNGTAGDVIVQILDFDGTGGTVTGDLSYLQIQNDTMPTVAGTSRAINSLSVLPSLFTGQVEIPLVPTINAHATSKQYVDQQISSVVSGLVFQSTWDARTQAQGGLAGDAGDPDLSAPAKKVVGHYYVVSTAGSATPNGAGTLPNSWNVGDWCIYVEQGATDRWEKLDQTFVSGAGAAGQVTYWNSQNEVAGDNDLFFDSTNKRLGIGTSSPSAKLQIESTSGNALTFSHTGQETYNISHGTSGLYLKLGNTLLTGWTQDHDFGIWDNSGDNYVMFDGSTQRVGIGSTSPTSKLHISSDSSTTVNIEAKNPTAFNDPTLNFITWNEASGSSSGKIQLINGTFNSNDMAFFTETSNSVTEKMRITSSGNVGIGTDSPVQKLHINNSIASSVSYAKFSNAQTGATTADGFDVGVNTTNEAIIWQRENSNLLFATNNTERMRIDSSGNVGIGTTSPGSLLSLQKDDSTVYDPTSDDGQRAIGPTILLNNNNTTTNTFGQIMYDTDASGQGVARIVFLDAGTASSAITFVTEQSNSVGERMRIDSAGNVGIGTDSPQGDLHVVGKTGTAGRIYLSDKDEGTSGTDSLLAMKLDADAYYYNRDTGKLFLGTNNDSTHLTINSSGNVGIGTTSPSHRLDLTTSDTTWAAAIKNTDATNGYGLFLQSAESASKAILGAYSGSSYKFYVRGDGNVGIGTNDPSSQLSIGGNAITTLKPTAVISDTTNGASLTLRGQSPVLFFDGTAAGVPKILMDGQGIEFKTGTLDTQGDVSFSLDSSGNATFAGNIILGDTPQIQLGTNNDAQINHNGSHLFIDNSVGNSYLRNTSTGSILLRNSTGGDIQFDNEFAGNILFNTSNITRLTIDSNGDATFAEKVNVAGSTNNESSLNVQTQTGSIGSIGFETGSEVTGIISSNTDLMEFRVGDGVGISSAKQLKIDTGGIEVTGDIEVTNSSDGLILKSPDGTRYRVTVANGGTLSVSAV